MFLTNFCWCSMQTPFARDSFLKDAMVDKLNEALTYALCMQTSWHCACYVYCPASCLAAKLKSSQ